MVVGVHIEKRVNYGFLQQTYSRQFFFSAQEVRQTERRDDGRAVCGSARATDTHLRMTLEL